MEFLSKEFLEEKKEKKKFPKTLPRKRRREGTLQQVQNQPVQKKKKKKIQVVKKIQKKRNLDEEQKLVFELFDSQDEDSILSGLNLLKGEKFTTKFINDGQKSILSRINEYRKHENELIQKNSFELISEWKKQGIVKLKSRSRVTKDEIEKLFESTHVKMRDYVINNFLFAMINGTDETIERCVEIVLGIEKEMLKKYRSTSSMGYKRKFREIYSNIKDPENDDLRERLVSGDVSCMKVVEMSSNELASEMKKVERKLLKKEKDRMKMEFEKDKVVDGLFTCRKCKKSKCTMYQMQTRSADEPMTQFVTCVTCGNKWKC